MTMLKRIATKTAAIAAAAAIGFTAMGDTALARGQNSGQTGVTIELAHKGHGGYGGYKTRCVAVAFRRNGARLKGTRGVAERKVQRRACRVAMRECRQRLDNKRYRTGRPFPFARCEVARVKRVAAHGHHHNYKGHNHHPYGYKGLGKKTYGGIYLKF